MLVLFTSVFNQKQYTIQVFQRNDIFILLIVVPSSESLLLEELEESELEESELELSSLLLLSDELESLDELLLDELLELDEVLARLQNRQQQLINNQISLFIA